VLLEWLGKETKEEKLGWFGVGGLTSSRPGNLACRLAQVTSVIRALQLHPNLTGDGTDGSSPYSDPLRSVSMEIL